METNTQKDFAMIWALFAENIGPEMWVLPAK
jgi:hypothetical protein